MQRLQRMKVSQLTAREPLPDLLGLGRKFGAHFRRGQTALIAAYPNNGKSALALWLSIHWARLGLRVLYFSADTDEWTTWKRAAAIVTGRTQSEVEQMVNGESVSDLVTAGLANLKGRLSFSFETDPTYTHLQEEIAAHWELWGEYPDVVMVDNLMDVVGDNEDEFAGMRDNTRAFKRLARITNTNVVTLHHCNEEKLPKGRDGTIRTPTHPPARAEVTGKVNQKAELELTLRLDDENGLFQIAPVKNRDGDKNEYGQHYVQLRADWSRMQLFTMNYDRLGAAA